MNVKTLLDYFQNRKTEMIKAVETLVRFESPSSEKRLLNKLAGHLQERFSHYTPHVDMIEQEKYGNQIRAEFGVNGDNGHRKPALILCHYDTVWAEGTLDKMQFHLEDGKAFGPGALDMKGGIVLVDFAFRAIQELKIPLARPVVLLLTGDEEIGSVCSRPVIEELARNACCALIPESPLTDGVLKTARKGCARYVVSIEGRAAHSGVEPEKGVNAITEMAHQILKINQLADSDKGTTVNVGVVSGGTKTNVVAPTARAEVDIRVWSGVEEQRIERAFQNLRAVNPEAKISVSGGFTRPPMERSEGNLHLFKQAKQIAEQLDFDLKEAATGGGSDGNFTAALGIPTLDGLGPVGEGVHAEHEHILVDSLPLRAALFTAMLLKKSDENFKIGDI